MTDKPSDAGKPGSRASGQSQARRPQATIDLQATEIERRDLPGDKPADKPKDSGEAPATATTGTSEAGKVGQPADASMTETAAAEAGAAGATSGAAAGGSGGSGDGGGASRASSSSASKPDNAALPPPRQRSGVGGFLSHTLAGIVGAVLALFGGDYLASNLGVEIPTFSANQMQQLTRRVGALEQDAKEHGADAASSALAERMDGLTAKVEQLAALSKSVSDLQAGQQQLTDKTVSLAKAAPVDAALADRLAKLEDTIKLLSQPGAGGSTSAVGQMAGLIARLDGVSSNIDARIAELQKSVLTDLQKQGAHFEDRLAQIDKGMSVQTVQATAKQLSDAIVGLKADGEKLRQEIATLTAGDQQMRQDLGALQQSASGLKGEIQGQAQTFVKTDDLAALKGDLGKMQTELAAISGRDQSREDSANRILLSLELANLKRAIERGGAFSRELADVKRLAPKDIDLKALEAGAEQGLPTEASLETSFHDTVRAVLDADRKTAGDGSLMDQLWAGAQSVVHVRKTGEVAGDTAEAILARTEARLKDGDLEGALKEASALKGDARAAAEPWLAKVSARLAVDQAMAGIESSLKKLMAPTTTN